MSLFGLPGCNSVRRLADIVISAQCRSDSLLLLSSLKVVVCGHYLVGLPLAVYETLALITAHLN